MGAFIVNINVRSDDPAAVERELKELTKAAWVTDAKNGWISVYEEEASTQDDRRIKDLSSGLSEALNAPVVAFLVHDSDFVCYWLIESGKLVDEFNSRPGYSDDDDESEADVPCRPELLIRYCVPGTQVDDVRRVLLDRDEIFAEENLRKLSELLGIDSARTNMDFESLKRGEDPSEINATFVGEGEPRSQSLRIMRRQSPASEGDEDDEDDFDETPGPRIKASDAAASLAKMFGWGGQKPSADPQVEKLVHAASENNVAEIERLVAAGVDIEAQAPMKSTLSSLMSARMLGGKLPFPVTPLMAALAHKQTDATRRLLQLGASAKTMHSMFGTPVHAAASGGQPELLHMVIEAGGDVNALNAHRQTPLQGLKYFRTMMSQMANLGQLGAALGKNVQAELKKLMPTPESLDECEQILVACGAR
jgi:hypothetical protein